MGCACVNINGDDSSLCKSSCPGASRELVGGFCHSLRVLVSCEDHSCLGQGVLDCDTREVDSLAN